MTIRPPYSQSSGRRAHGSRANPTASSPNGRTNARMKIEPSRRSSDQSSESPLQPTRAASGHARGPSSRARSSPRSSCQPRATASAATTAYRGSRRFASSSPSSTGTRIGTQASVANASAHGQRRMSAAPPAARSAPAPAAPARIPSRPSGARYAASPSAPRAQPASPASLSSRRVARISKRKPGTPERRRESGELAHRGRSLAGGPTKTAARASCPCADTTRVN